VETPFEGVQSEIDLSVLELVRGVEGVVAGGTDALTQLVWSTPDRSQQEGVCSQAFTYSRNRASFFLVSKYGNS